MRGELARMTFYRARFFLLQSLPCKIAYITHFTHIAYIAYITYITYIAYYTYLTISGNSDLF